MRAGTARRLGLLSLLVLARLRQAPGRRSVVILGLALPAVLPLVSATMSMATVNAAMEKAVTARPPGERSVIVSYNGLTSPQDLEQYDRTVRRLLPRLTGDQPIRRQLIFRQISDTRGGEYVLGARDDLADAVQVTRGRLPRACSPTRCEVISLGDPDDAQDQVYLDPSLGLTLVGHARRIDPLLLTGTFDPGAPVPILLADGVRAASQISALSVRQRTVGWVAPLDLDLVREVGVDGWVREGAQVADEAWIAHPGLVLTTVDAVLREESERAQASAGRFTVLGSGASVLLLGTAVLGGAALRPGCEAFGFALRRRGATRQFTTCVSSAEAVATATCAVLVGAALGAVACAAVAYAGGLDPVLVVTSSLSSAAVHLVALWLAACAVLAVTLAAPPAHDLGVRASHALAAAGAGLAALALLLAARGGVGTQGSVRRDPLLAALPALVLVAGSLLLAAAWPSLVRGTALLLPRRALAARLGLAAAVGRPLRPLTSAALITAAVGACVFAGAYGATLTRGAADQAAYAVPLDARLTTGSALVPPAQVATPDAVATGLGGAHAFGVVRATGSVRATASRGQALQVLGIDPDALRHVARWEAVTGGGAGRGPLDIARRIQGDTRPWGIPLPAGRQLSITTAAAADIAVSAYVRAEDGREAGVPLAVTSDTASPGAPPALRGDLVTWRDARGRPAALRLTALVLRQPPDEATRVQHALGERRSGIPASSGALTLLQVRVDGRQVPKPWQGWSQQQGQSEPNALRIDYVLTSGEVVLTPAPPTSGPVPVVVDPATAAEADGGQLTVTLSGTAVPARIVGVLERFPTIASGARFALTHATTLSRLLDTADPGTGEPSEIWVKAPDAGGPDALATRLAEQPWTRLAVTQRTLEQERLGTDPVAAGARRLLGIAALLTLLVAVCALAVLVAADAGDDAAQNYAWEADGVSPGTLRASLWWRAVAVAIPGVLGGVLVGLTLTSATARLVLVTATATTPQPPLAADALSGWSLGVTLIGLACGLAVAGIAAATRLRTPLPVRGDVR